jgi:phosphoenolpyruvate carboxykinase (ATP)
MHTMLIRPTKQQLAEFGKPDFVIYNAGAFPANSLTAGMGSKTSVDLSIEDNEMVILGTEYAGEMKKGVFTLANYLAPKRGILSMH